MHHKCYGCVNFTEYYIKHSSRFAMAGCGECKIKKQRISRHSTCAEFKRKPEPCKLNCAAILDELEQALTSLNGIKLIFNESEKD